MSNQMSSQRQLRFSELIRSLISECLLIEDFYNLSFEISSITISFVKMSKDLRVANVYLMPLGGKNKNKITEELNKKKFIFPKYNLLTKSSSWHLFIIRLNFQNMNKSKNNIINFLKKSGILVKTHYPPLSTFTLIKKKISASIKHPNVKEYYKSAFSIPIYYGLTFKDQKKIIKILNKV